MREPQAIAEALNEPAWQRSFVGKTSHNKWQMGHDISSVPAIAQNSAQAIIEGARSLIILHDVGAQVSSQTGKG
jgi:hypothetical protein